MKDLLKTTDNSWDNASISMKSIDSISDANIDTLEHEIWAVGRCISFVFTFIFIFRN